MQEKKKGWKKMGLRENKGFLRTRNRLVLFSIGGSQFTELDLRTPQLSYALYRIGRRSTKENDRIQIFFLSSSILHTSFPKSASVP